MRDRTREIDHKLRVAILAVIHDIGGVRALISSPNINQADRDFYEQMLDRAQRSIHAIQERVDAHPPRPAGH